MTRLAPWLTMCLLVTGCAGPMGAATETAATTSAAKLVNTWVYQSLVFTNPDGTNTNATGDVSGTLTFRADGTFKQDMRIGDFVNAVDGRYTVTGDQLETAYTWGGREEKALYTFSIQGGTRLEMIRLKDNGGKDFHYLVLRDTELAEPLKTP